MSNIANQLIAVVATLLGFVAHDALTERNAPATVVASSTVSATDPVVTRSINLEGLSSDWLDASRRAERAGQPRPVMALSAGTAAAMPNSDHATTVLADVRINNARIAAPGERTDSFLR